MIIEELLESQAIYKFGRTVDYFVIYEKWIKKEVTLSKTCLVEHSENVSEVVKLYKGNAKCGSVIKITDYPIGPRGFSSLEEVLMRIRCYPFDEEVKLIV
ncbi:hypothetical protein [Bacillus sp. SG-1]|uniref:hypothetical protein n=1 Tax=Bacillus sp. SG-1 TaxID=161544 RepID=UPI0012EA0297|nr:hypothetical protein [Bacillus sp. SG-1]